jgi:hypothetical protein
MTQRVFRTSPYRPFTSFLPYDLKDANIGQNGQGYFDPLNEKIDLEWGGYREDDAFNNYFDYFFSGEDIKLYIDGLFDESDQLDTASMAFVIKQEKQPLYGFWSYNYDAMMLGTRLITGELSIYTRYPRRMTSLLEKAAKKRSESNSRSPSSNVLSVLSSDYETTDDERNVEKYWLNSQLDRITSDPQSRTLNDLENSGHNIFSAHPPFNLIVMYGTEEVAMSSNVVLSQNSSNEINRQLNSDRIMATDLNERKTTINSDNTPMKVVLQNVHLMAMTTSYNSGGQALIENYQFVARDMYMTDAKLDQSTQTRASSPDYTSQDNAQPNQTTSTTTSGTPSGGPRN